jgi:NAD(P)H-flavin reductase
MDLLEHRVQRIRQLNVFYFVERWVDTDPVLNESIGYLSVEPIWSKIGNPLEANYYLSGPPAMLKFISLELIERGISKASIKIDAWE